MGLLDVKKEARAFRIWQQGHSVGWDCTASEVAEATGIHRETVIKICRERDWPIRSVSRGGYIRGEPNNLIRLFGGSPMSKGSRREGEVRVDRIIEEMDRDEIPEILTLAD